MADVKKDYLKRLVLYCLGLIILCFGVVLNTKTNLGVAAINVIPYVVSKTTDVTLGTAVFILYCVLIILQCIIAKKISIVTFLQLPVSLLFGKMVDFINMRILTFSASNIVVGLVMLFIAINLVAIGTTIVVEQNIIPNAPDGFVQTLGKKLNWPFGKTKICFDVTCVILATIVSYIMAKKIIGIGIGTLVSMICTGLFCGKYKKLFYHK